MNFPNLLMLSFLLTHPYVETAVNSSTISPIRQIVCNDSLQQSPINIQKKDLTRAVNDQGLCVTSIEDGRRHHVTVMVRHSRIVVQPDYSVFIYGDKIENNYDLYAVHLYPKKLHTIEGMATPEMEIHFKFIKSPPNGENHPVYDPNYIVEAARSNNIMSIVQLVTQLKKDHNYTQNGIEDLMNCIQQLVGKDNITCAMTLYNFDISSGFYVYFGSLMYPTCEESVTYLIGTQFMKLKTEDIRLIRSITPNFTSRKQQPLNGRTVEFNHPSTSSLASLPLSSVLWIVVVGYFVVI